jgi:hypothetical protein
MNLYNYFLTNQGARIIKNAHYFRVYEQYFARFVNTPVLMYEIGTGEGGSAQMWKRYFGPMARIVTIDVRDCSHVAESQIYVRTGSQNDEVFLNGLLGEFGSPDIVLDDGSHRMPDVNKSFDVLFPHLKSGGVYLVEDLNTAYWPDMGGGYKAPGSFIERAKDFIDQLYAEQGNGGPVPETEFTRTAFSIAFFYCMVVMEKSAYVNKELLYLPQPTTA